MIQVHVNCCPFKVPTCKSYNCAISKLQASKILKSSDFPECIKKQQK